jgi:cell division septation protein DedD
MPTGGGYLVQVSSQRSEAEAQAALRSVQSKFPNVVGGQPATVRRAELGDRGTFYRAMLGPFASRDQATQLCSSLKAAGGTCIVAGN